MSCNTTRMKNTTTPLVWLAIAALNGAGAYITGEGLLYLLCAVAVFVGGSCVAQLFHRSDLADKRATYS